MGAKGTPLVRNVSNPMDYVAAMSQRLNNIVGLRLCLVRRAAATRMFHFGELFEEGGRSWGEWVLSVECPWRIQHGSQIVTGSQDISVPRVPVSVSETWNYDLDGNVQDSVIAEWLGSPSAGGRSVRNMTDLLVVEAVRSDAAFDVSVDLSGDFRLLVFPAGSHGSQWRLFNPEHAATAILVGDGGVDFDVM